MPLKMPLSRTNSLSALVSATPVGRLLDGSNAKSTLATQYLRLRRLKALAGLAWQARQLILQRQSGQCSQAEFDQAAMAWQAELLNELGLHVRSTGEALPGPCMLAANHISWLDPILLTAQAPYLCLAKAEVGQWPGVAALTKAMGTIFIRRGQHDTAKISQQFLAGLQAKQALLFFPEGSTTLGNELAYFFPRLFAAAQQAGLPVQPVAIAYHDTVSPPRAAFVAQMGFFPHLWRLLSVPETQVTVHYLAPISSQQKSRKQLANQVRTAIAQALHLPASQAQCCDRALQRASIQRIREGL